MDRAPLTASTARVMFYDVECLPNVFSVCVYNQTSKKLHIFHLVDGDLRQEFASQDADVLRKAVFKANPALPTDTKIILYDLHDYEANHILAFMFGMFSGDKINAAPAATLIPVPETPPNQHPDLLFRPVCDTDPTYDPRKHPLLAGYNSLYYDTVILSLYLKEAFQTIRDVFDNRSAKAVKMTRMIAKAEEAKAEVTRTAATEIPGSFKARKAVEEAEEAAKNLEHAKQEQADALRASPRFEPTSAATMAAHNEKLFSEQFKGNMPSALTRNSVEFCIRRAWLDCGRHIDIARFNEGTQIALKRVLAGMGRQILEFKSGFTEAVGDIGALNDLLTYNVSDVVGLAAVFQHPSYAATFDLKAGLLNEYPECVYFFGEPASPRNVRRRRLGLDSTAAQFAARVLAPGKPLSDIPAVSFLYPHQDVVDAHNKAKKTDGALFTPMERRDILDETLEWFSSQMDDTPEARAAVGQVEAALSYYRDLGGKNFNSSGNHVGGDNDAELSSIAKTPNNVPYFCKDGSMSTGYVNFSVGGIHGAEFDSETWEADRLRTRQRNTDRETVALLHPDPLDVWEATAGDKTIDVDGRQWSRSALLTPATRKRDLVARREDAERLTLTGQEALDGFEAFTQRWAGIGHRPLEPEPPLFIDKTDGSNKLAPKYTFTSVGPVIHEDFTSYYPNLLRNMAAFSNPELGEDRYATIFERKQQLSRQLKTPGLPAQEKARLKVLLEGTKLVLNSATGAADSSRDTAIRMNNQILSMRIIGQLLTWRVGQAQTFAGATIVSTNTDGLYSMGLDEAVNNAVLADEAAAINIGIEPEPLLIVSKDSNNRIEFGDRIDDDRLRRLMAEDPFTSPADFGRREILSAGGGMLAAFRGPTPKKSLAHPAVQDWVLARYLGLVAAGEARIDQPFDMAIGEQLVREAAALDPFHAARLFQHVLVSNSTTKLGLNIAFGIDSADGLVELSHINRVFFTVAGAPDAITLSAATSSTVENAESLDLLKKASKILRLNGWSVDGVGGTAILPTGRKPGIRKINGIGSDWPAIVANHDLLLPPEGKPTPAEIVAMLDLGRYVGMVKTAFETNWMNNPDRDAAGDDQDDDQDDARAGDA